MNQLQTRSNYQPQVQQNKVPTFSQFVTGPAIKNKIMELYGSKDGTKFTSAIVSAVTNNPTLQECFPMTVLNCAFLGEALKLSPSPQLGHYYMVPFKNKKENNRKEAQFIIGYKGYIQLAIRSGQYQTINVIEVREGEVLGRDPETGEYLFKFNKNEAERMKLPVIGYKGYFKLTNGFFKSIYWPKEKMIEHANEFSMAFNKKDYEAMLNGTYPKKDLWKLSSFWYKNFDSQAFKTIIRQLISKWGIMSIEMQQAYNADMAAVDERGNPTMYPDNDKEFSIQNEIDENQGKTIIPVNPSQPQQPNVQPENPATPAQNITGKEPAF